MPTSAFDENGSAIDSSGEEKHRRFGRMNNDADVYIYPQRVERTDRKRKVYIQAQFKDVSTRLGPTLAQES